MQLMLYCTWTGSWVCSTPCEVCTSTNMSKKLSAGKSTPGTCWLTWPGDTSDGDSRTVMGPNTGELPVSSIEIISVWMVVRPPGPQPTHGFWRCTVDGPFNVTLSDPRPGMSTIILPPDGKVSVPAGGNMHGVAVRVGVGG